MHDRPLRTSKLSKARSSPDSQWYQYYAGYAPEFVDDVLSMLGAAGDVHVVDPWNGTGTTTTRAARAGLTATGLEINPALVVIARGQLLGAELLEGLPDLTAKIIERASLLARRTTVLDDPLLEWFTPACAGYLRSYDRAIQGLVLDREQNGFLVNHNLTTIAPLAASILVVLFRVARSLLAPRLSSNPTWFKKPKHPDQRVRADGRTIAELFARESQTCQTHLRRLSLHSSAADRARIVLGTSTAANFGVTPFDLLIGSPPYCTRIDYAVATAPELAILGLDADRMNRLRGLMMGTPTVATYSAGVTNGWGELTRRTLDDVRSHQSKASRGYYHKVFWQYFRDLRLSMSNITRQASPNAQMCLVVQDSHYKDVAIRLADIVVEMAEGEGWFLTSRHRFAARGNMASLNPRARRYRSDFNATESALFFARSKRPTRVET